MASQFSVTDDGKHSVSTTSGKDDTVFLSAISNSANIYMDAFAVQDLKKMGLSLIFFKAFSGLNHLQTSGSSFWHKHGKMP